MKKKKKGQSGSKEGSCNNFDHEGYRELVQDKEKREYLLHVPKSYDSSQPCPLVINYHGFGDCASDYAANVGNALRFNAAATKNKFLVAYPQAAFREKGAPLLGTGRQRQRKYSDERHILHEADDCGHQADAQH